MNPDQSQPPPRQLHGCSSEFVGIGDVGRASLNPGRKRTTIDEVSGVTKLVLWFLLVAVAVVALMAWVWSVSA